MDWHREQAEAIDVAVRAGFSRGDAEILAAVSRPALRLVPASRGRAAVGASKLGGLVVLCFFADLDPESSEGRSSSCRSSRR